MSKGVFFSVMMLMLITALLSLYTVAITKDNQINSNISEVNSFQRVSDKFANIKNNYTKLAISGNEKTIDQRIIPFVYDVNSQGININTKLPVRTTLIDSYLETINAFKIFLEDTNYSNEFDSLEVDINTIMSPLWGGSYESISFLIKPQELLYSITDDNSLLFNFIGEDYNYFSMKKQEIEISPYTGSDFNSLSCHFNGLNTCLNEDYNSEKNLPYIYVFFKDSSCSSCSISQNIIKGHFNPLQRSTIKISCIGATCTSQDFDLNFSNLTKIQHNGVSTEINIFIDLNSTIEEFYFNDVNLLVKNETFGTKRWN